jgi:hypothetical protein
MKEELRNNEDIGYRHDYVPAEGISQPWHCLAPRLGAKSQGSRISWKEVYRAVVSRSMLSVEVVLCNTFISSSVNIAKILLRFSVHPGVERVLIVRLKGIFSIG